MRIKNYILNLLINASKQRLLLPFYHLVAEETPIFAKHLYPARSSADFKNDLDVFLQFYDPISLQKMIELVETNQHQQKKQVHITFDDGLSNFYTTVAPILKEKNIPATIFVNTDFIDNKDLFYRYKASLLIEEYVKANVTKKLIFESYVQKHTQTNNVKSFLLSIDFHQKQQLDELATLIGYDFKVFLKTEKPYLTTAQIKELINDGFTIGAHSKNHPLYSKLSEEEQLMQTTESIECVTQKFNVKYKAFSFPFTDLGVKKSFFKELKNQKNIDVSFGISGIKKDDIPFNFQRIIFEKADKNTLLFLIKCYLKYFLKTPFQKQKMPRV